MLVQSLKRIGQCNNAFSENDDLNPEQRIGKSLHCFASYAASSDIGSQA